MLCVFREFGGLAPRLLAPSTFISFRKKWGSPRLFDPPRLLETLEYTFLTVCSTFFYDKYSRQNDKNDRF